MKTMISFLLLAVVNSIHCQEHDQINVFTLEGVVENLKGFSDNLEGFKAVQQKQEEIMEKLMGHEELLHRIPDMQEKLEPFEKNLKDVQKKLGNLETLFQAFHHYLEGVIGSVVTNQDSIKNFHSFGPATVIRGEGYIKQVRRMMTHAEMEDFCRGEGGRLLQKFDATAAVDVWNAFGFYWNMWIGVYDEKWTSDESLVPKDLLGEGHQSDPSRRCGILPTLLYPSIVSQTDCSSKNWGFCQFNRHHQPLP